MTHSRYIALSHIDHSLARAGERLLTAVEADGFEVIGLSKREDIVSAAARCSPDIILLSPFGKRGYELCQRLKKHAVLSHVPVVFIAQKAIKADIIRGLKAGAVDYIVRPFNHEEILARFHSHIRQRRSATVPPVAPAEARDEWLDSLPALVMEVGRNGEIYHFRYPPPELELAIPYFGNPKSLSEVFPINPSLVLLDAIFQVGEDRPLVTATCSVEPESGTEWLEFTVVRRRGAPEGERFIVLVHNITARKQAEQERRSAEEALRQEQRMESIGRLAGGVSHDMNNILSVIMGLASKRRSGAEPGSEEREEMDEIMLACRKGYDLTTKLSSLATGMSFHRGSLSLNQMIGDAVDLLARAVPEHITFKTDLSDDLADIIGDPVMIHHVVINLALSAVDAIAKSGIVEFSTRNYLTDSDLEGDYPKLEPGRYVVLQVTDTSRGMSDAEKAHAFEPFYSSNPSDKGFGLGLPIVYGIVRNHGGQVVLRSAVGQGTTVRVFLPASMSEDDLPNPRTTVPLQTQKCLVVDDEEMILFSNRRLLHALGCSAITANSGEEAVRIFSKHRDNISFVILDLVMPDMDGFETLAELRKIDPEVRVLICTGYFKEGDTSMNQLVMQDTVGFLRKPFGLVELSDALDTLMSKG